MIKFNKLEIILTEDPNFITVGAKNFPILKMKARIAQKDGFSGEFKCEMKGKSAEENALGLSSGSQLNVTGYVDFKEITTDKGRTFTMTDVIITDVE